MYIYIYIHNVKVRNEKTKFLYLKFHALQQSSVITFYKV